MAVGSELAALLEARRRKNDGDDGNNDNSGGESRIHDPAASSRGSLAARRSNGTDVNNNNNNVSGSSGSGASWIKNKPASSNETANGTVAKQATTAALKPVTSTPSGTSLKPSATASTTTSGKSCNAAPPSSSSSSTPPPAVPSPKHATVMRNPQLQQRMDRANLEAGIPTPNFLVEMRKNLKSKSDRGGDVTGTGTVGGVGTDLVAVAGGKGMVEHATADKRESNRVKEQLHGKSQNKEAENKQTIRRERDEPSTMSSPAAPNIPKDKDKDTANVVVHTHATTAKNSKLSSFSPASSSVASASTSKSTTSATTTVTISSLTISSPRHASELAARRSRLVAHRHGTTSSGQQTAAVGGGKNNHGNTNNNKHEREESVGNSANIVKKNGHKDYMYNSPGNHDNNNSHNHNNEGSSSNSNNEGKGANLRRERILAKVRANTTLHKTNKEGNNSVHSSDGDGGSETTDKDAVTGIDKKIKVTSPHAEEVEMLFADEGFVMSGSGSNEELQQQPQGGQQPQQRKESMEQNIGGSINNSGNSKLSSSLAMAALAAKKNQSQSLASQDASSVHAIAEDSPSIINGTPQKGKSNSNGGGLLNQHQRLHTASTPKIRGNCQYRRDHFDEEKDEGNQNQQQHTPQRRQQQQDVMEEESTSQDQWTPIVEKQRRNSITNNNLPHQPSPQSQSQYLRPLEDEKIHGIHQAYSLNERAPSTISAISGISIPSCFPQESPFGHLQQPLLVGGSSGFNGTYSGSGQFVNTTPIKESTSFPSATSNISGGVHLGLLNTLNIAPKSSPQAVGGLATSAFSSGVENENRRLREQISAMQKKLDEKDAIISQLMKRIGDLENTTRANDADKSSQSGASNSYSIDHDAYAMSSLWERSRPASDLAYTPYGDAESISMTPSPHQHVKQSPSTTHTSSTASLTTATSGKSQPHQRQSSSRSLPGQQSPAGLMGRMKRSPHRRGNASIGVPNGADDRRFQC